jgi:hypothetical protein
MVALLERLQQFIIRTQAKLNEPIGYKKKHIVWVGAVVIALIILL